MAWTWPSTGDAFHFYYILLKLSVAHFCNNFSNWDILRMKYLLYVTLSPPEALIQVVLLLLFISPAAPCLSESISWPFPFSLTISVIVTVIFPQSTLPFYLIHSSHTHAFFSHLFLWARFSWHEENTILDEHILKNVFNILSKLMIIKKKSQSLFSSYNMFDMWLYIRQCVYSAASLYFWSPLMSHGMLRYLVIIC